MRIVNVFSFNWRGLISPLYTAHHRIVCLFGWRNGCQGAGMLSCPARNGDVVGIKRCRISQRKNGKPRRLRASNKASGFLCSALLSHHKHVSCHRHIASKKLPTGSCHGRYPIISINPERNHRKCHFMHLLPAEKLEIII